MMRWSDDAPRRLGDSATVTVDGNLEAALRILKRRLAKAGVIAAVRRHAFAQSPGERRRAKRREALKRARRAARRRELYGPGPR